MTNPAVAGRSRALRRRSGVHVLPDGNRRDDKRKERDRPREEHRERRGAIGCGFRLQPGATPSGGAFVLKPGAAPASIVSGVLFTVASALTREIRNIGRKIPDRRDETIPATVQCLDIRRMLRIVTKSLTQHADRLGERRFRHERVAPHGTDQVLLGDELARPVEQHGQDADDARRERQLDAVPRKETARAVEQERAEREKRAFTRVERDRRGVCPQGVDVTTLNISSGKLGALLMRAS